MEAKILRIYLDRNTLKMAREGGFGFVNKVKAAFEGEGFRVDLMRGNDEGRLKSAGRRGYALFHMKDPFHDRALSMRRAYYHPYWRIEATDKRWEFDVARKPFDPAEIDPDIAQEWYRNWQRWLFRDGPSRACFDPLIYVPLQGRLCDHRSFQTVSPVEMIKAVQDRAGDRQILLGLHPGETYSKAELETVSVLAEADSRITLQTGGMDEALRRCELVVTQNSTAALSGYFFGKPALRFAKTDFHHVMPLAKPDTIDEAFAAAREDTPFATYLYWFVELNAIKADTPDAEDKILVAVRRHGWEI